MAPSGCRIGGWMRIRFIGDPTFRRYHRPGPDGFILWAGEEHDVSDAVGGELLRDFGPLFIRVNVDAAPVDRQVKEATRPRRTAKEKQDA